MDESIRTAALAAVYFAISTLVLALDVAWVHSNAAAQSVQRPKACFEAWLK